MATMPKLGCALMDALNTRDLEPWARMLDPEFRADYPGAPALDAAAAKLYNGVYLRAFSDLRFVPERIVETDDVTMVVWHGSGTFDGPLVMTDRVVQPTGRSGQVRGVLVAQTRGGRIVREQSFWNQAELFQQLGVTSGR